MQVYSLLLLFLQIITLAVDEALCYSPSHVTGRRAFVAGTFVSSVFVAQFLLDAENADHIPDNEFANVQERTHRSSVMEEGLIAMFSRRHSWVERRLEREIIAAQRKSDAVENTMNEIAMARFAGQE